MRTRRSPSVFFALVVLGALLAGGANAQDNNPPPNDRRGPGAPSGPGSDRGFGGRGGGLALDEKQRELITEARKTSAEDVRALEEKLRLAQRDFVRATLAEKYDEKAVREKADSVAKIQSDIAVLNAKAFASVAPTLKPEQREQFETSSFGYAYVTGAGGRGGFGGGGGGQGFAGRGGNAPGDANAPGVGRGGRSGNTPTDPNAPGGGRRRGGGQ